MGKKEILRCENCGENKLPGSMRKHPVGKYEFKNFCLTCIEIDNQRKDKAPAEEFTGDKYKRGYRGQVFDVYDIIEMWEVTCPALQHAIKKILVPGKRGKNDALADLKEARDALTRAIELQEMREDRGHDD